jgi:hypothetical protein
LSLPYDVKNQFLSIERCLIQEHNRLSREQVDFKDILSDVPFSVFINYFRTMDYLNDLNAQSMNMFLLESSNPIRCIVSSSHCCNVMDILGIEDSPMNTAVVLADCICKAFYDI